MHHYIINFAVYTLAMLGIIFVAFIAGKKLLMVDIKATKEKFLSIEDRLNLEPRKNIYVIRAGKERFLVATDTEGSHYLTKLDYSSEPKEDCHQKIQSNTQIDNILSILGTSNQIIAKNNPVDQPRILRKILKRLDSKEFPNSGRIKG